MSSVEDIFELSPMQHGLLFDSLAVRDSGMHMVQLVYDLGDVDPAALERAWQAVVDRHAMLRTSFQWEDLEKPLQVVQSGVSITVRNVDWSELSDEQQRERLEQFLKDDRKEGFEFDVAPLFRICLCRLGEGRYQFVWSFHHILFEGWSASVILKDMLAFYGAEKTGEPVELPDPPRYRDYISWTQAQALGDAEPFWREYLAGFKVATPLPALARTASSQPEAGAYDACQLRLTKEQSDRLTTFARSHHVTLSTIIQGAWALLLSRTSGESDIVFGTMVSGRSAPVPGVDRMVGLFVNILPARVRIDPEATVSAWLQGLQLEQARLRAFEHLPLVQVKTWGDVPAGQALFQTLAIFENWQGDVTLKDAGSPLEVHDVQGHHGGPGFPLSLVSWPGDKLSLSISYECELFTREAVEQLLGQLATILTGFMDGEAQLLNQVPLLTSEQELALLQEWTPPQRELPADTFVHQLFEAQAERTPEATAVVFRGQSLTFAELNSRANQLAHTLRDLGIGPESRVGLCLERSLDLVVGIWGVLKAGGAYVPIDPKMPTHRVSFVFKDAGMPVLLTQESLAAKLPQTVETVICLDSAWADTMAAASTENPTVPLHPDNMAFVTYTSGSTGQPKASMALHGGLLNAFLGWDQAYSLSQVKSFLVMASFAVDVFTADVVRSLCSGGRLVMASYDDLLTPPSLCELLINEKIEFAEFVPHVLGHVIDHLEATSQTLSDLSVLIIGSDVWLGSEWARAHRVCGAQARMINAYGLNETSVDCTYFEDTIDDEPPRGYVPIGKPFLNHRIYILDTEGRPVPTGVPGELHIGGPGVVRGYWNRPDITAERFLPDPFSEIAGARMLKTGDRVRMHPDGNMEVLGRVDDQVKVRAFRVELGEIECVLLDHPDIRQAAVVVREDEQGERQLVAYLVADAPLSTPDIRRYLVELLPTYMVPSMVLQLDELPLTANRLKVDRAALPTPDWSARTSDDGFVAPSTEMECQLAQMWLDVLPVDRVGVHDNFMDLGGHSLLLIPVLARIEKDFGVRLVPGELVLATLGQLVATVEQHQAQPQEVGRRSLLSRVFRRH